MQLHAQLFQSCIELVISLINKLHFSQNKNFIELMQFLNTKKKRNKRYEKYNNKTVRNSLYVTAYYFVYL